MTQGISGIPSRDISRFTLDAAPAAVALAGHLVHANPTLHTLFELPMQALQEGVGQDQISYRLLVRNGSTLAMRSRSRCSARQPDGTLTVIGIEQDLSELDELRQAPEHSSLPLNGAVEAHTTPLHAVDRSLRYTCYNAAHRDTMLRDYYHEPRLGDKATPELPGSVYQRQVQDHLRRALADQEVHQR